MAETVGLCILYSLYALACFVAGAFLLLVRLLGKAEDDFNMLLIGSGVCLIAAIAFVCCIVSFIGARRQLE